MPEDLAAQIEPIHRAVRALGWPVLAIEGVEADDIIGTPVRAAEQGVDTIVSTGDKDPAQLVNSQVTLVNTMSEVLNEAGVLNSWCAAGSHRRLLRCWSATRRQRARRDQGRPQDGASGFPSTVRSTS